MILVSCNNADELPRDLKEKIEKSYEPANLKSAKGLFGKTPKLSQVKEPTPNDPATLPDWISNKSYITENVDALKYNPSLLVGALVKLEPDGKFDIYSVTYNVRSDGELTEMSKVEKPLNFYEQTFNSNSRFNSDFLIGGASISNDQVLKITYAETNYINLTKYDSRKIDTLRENIKGIPGANLKDWAIIRGIVILDCTYSKSTKTAADANVKASWISADGAFFQQKDNTNNFRLVSVDLENLFLVK